jgi:signal transduction histidine kinase
MSAKSFIEDRRSRSRARHEAKKEYEDRKREIFMLMHMREGESRHEAREKLVELEKDYQDKVGRSLIKSLFRERGGGGVPTNEDFRRHYRRMKAVRPIFGAIVLGFWVILFFFGGYTVAIRALITIIALVLAWGGVIEFIHTSRVDTHILGPVEALERAAAKVAAGDFEARVDPSRNPSIGALVSAFNAMVAALERDQELASQYERDRKDLIANISHDLKTPIASIQGYVEAMEDDRLDDPDRRKRYLKVILANASYMNKLIDDLFLFSRLDMRKLDFHFETMRLKPFMRDLVEELALDVQELGADFLYEDGIGEGAVARIDAKRFQQALRNLVSNAVKHGPKEGLVVDMGAASRDGLLVVETADNGPGIPPDKLGRLFERFYRIESERTKDLSSTGLGLAIAKELVEAHGGRISARNREGGGAVFRIELPLGGGEA